MDITTTFILVRALERLLIVFIGGASLWMGWQLFLRLQTEADQNAELSWKEVSVKLQRVGPGVFFGAFGAVILGIALYNLPTLQPQMLTAPAQQQPAAATPGANSGVSSASAAASPGVRMLSDQSPQQIERMIVTLNLAMVLQNTPSPTSVPERNWTDFKKGDVEVALLRNELLRVRFGLQPVAEWLRARQGNRQVPLDAPKAVREVDDLAAKLTHE